MARPPLLSCSFMNDPVAGDSDEWPSQFVLAFASIVLGGRRKVGFEHVETEIDHFRDVHAVRIGCDLHRQTVKQGLDQCGDGSGRYWPDRCVLGQFAIKCFVIASRHSSYRPASRRRKSSRWVICDKKVYCRAKNSG